MKKKLRAELKDLAEKILSKDQETTTSSLKQQARELYEKITVLAFAEENLKSLSTEAEEKVIPKKIVPEQKPEPVVEQVKMRMQESTHSAPKTQASILFEEASMEKDEYLPDGTEYNDGEAITEPNTEKIKDIVAHMPPETQNLDNLISNIITSKGVDQFTEPPAAPKKDFRDIGVDYDNLPDFEPVKKQDKDQRPKSLNDRLKNGINIGLNERLAFIRHLFEGKSEDYNRVVSQLNTFDSVTEAKKFIQLVVKPDYKNWAGKEEYEQKFLELVENKFK